MSMTSWVPAVTAFLASAVEAVEALTIVLAVGVTRSWRVALSGAAWALVTLAAIVVLAGPAIVAYVPFAALRTGIGIFLLLFGMSWLRKAVLRYSGRKALHDEAAIFARETAALRERTGERVGFATAYNAVLLEGLEVAVIVVTLGAASAAALRSAALGALGAVGVVAAAGAVLRGPAARVPENALKFVVGLMLTAVGTFWTGEGLGIAWPGDDLALPIIVAIFAAVSAVTIAVARRPVAAELRKTA